MVSGAAKRWGSIGAAVASYWYKTRSCQPHWAPCPLLHPCPLSGPERTSKNKIEVHESGQGRKGKSGSFPLHFFIRWCIYRSKFSLVRFVHFLSFVQARRGLPSTLRSFSRLALRRNTVTQTPPPPPSGLTFEIEDRQIRA